MDIQRTVFQVVILGGIIYYAVCSFFDTPLQVSNNDKVTRIFNMVGCKPVRQ